MTCRMKENLQKKRKLQDPGKCECKMMAQTENLIVKMNRQYKDFSKGQKKLADYICKNYDKAVFLTAARLGAEVGVSKSSYDSTFCHAAGISGISGVLAGPGRTGQK